MTKSYHYTECGLTNVYLTNGFRVEDDGSLFIEDIRGLHKVIGLELALAPRKLKGREIRFIRHYMDLSQKMFGDILKVDYQTVLRWETSKNVIPSTADKLLKLIFLAFLAPDSAAKEIVDDLSDIDNDRGKDIKLSHNDEWTQAA